MKVSQHIPQTTANRLATVLDRLVTEVIQEPGNSHIDFATAVDIAVTRIEEGLGWHVPGEIEIMHQSTEKGVNYDSDR